jgi:hypothetical protein
VRLHRELKRAATSSEGPGTPAELRTSSRVVNVDTSTATVFLEDGGQLQGDLVIGADGVHVSDHVSNFQAHAPVLDFMLTSPVNSPDPASTLWRKISKLTVRARVLSDFLCPVKQLSTTQKPPGLHK